MRQHFHRCPNLRVVALDVADLPKARGRGHGKAILEELCEAKRLTPCVGLVECDLLPLAQKRELLVSRATRLREEAGGTTRLAGPTPERADQLLGLRCELLEERQQIVEANREIEAQIAFATDISTDEARPEEAALAEPGLTVRVDEALERLRVGRLDELDRALEAMDAGDYGICAACRGTIALERLRLHPNTHVCEPCARKGLPAS